MLSTKKAERTDETAAGKSSNSQEVNKRNLDSSLRVSTPQGLSYEKFVSVVCCSKRITGGVGRSREEEGDEAKAREKKMMRSFFGATHN